MKAGPLATAGWIAVLCLQSGVANAQNISAGTVTGTVTDPSNAAIAGALVTLSNPVSNYKQTTATDQSGAFRFVFVPLSVYHLDVKSEGFAPFSSPKPPVCTLGTGAFTVAGAELPVSTPV